VWKDAPTAPALDEETLLRNIRFAGTVAERRLDVPLSERNTNRMFPNRPVAGWEEQNSKALSEVLDDLSRAGALFIDGLTPNRGPLRVAMKIELNMGIEGPPSVTDPVVTGAVLYELLERAFARDVHLHFTVGDSCGIENAPVGRTSMDIMRETGNFHHALKAGLRFTLRRDGDAARRDAASGLLGRIAELESATPPVFFASPADRVTSLAEVAQAESLAGPWVRCVDYDEDGFVAVRTDLGPLGLSLWGGRDFQVARSWVEADHRVHVTRGCSTHLFAGWTGSLKGLVGLHALGLRPADQGLNELGQSPLDLLSAMMHLSGFNGIVGTKAGVGDLRQHLPKDAESLVAKSRDLWQRLSRAGKLLEGWKHWIGATTALERELRADLKNGNDEPAVMAKMRRLTRSVLDEADRRSPGFRDALWAAVYDGTRSGLLGAWRVRSIIPSNLRDARMGMRIGVLTHLPMQAELVVQGLPKIGIGGGPDAYELVHDAGVLVAGTDEISVDLAALRAAGVPGNPWQYNWPIHGALQLGRGPALWEEIKFVEAQSGSAASTL
jgi:hypothetical protein